MNITLEAAVRNMVLKLNSEDMNADLRFAGFTFDKLLSYSISHLLHL